MTKMVLLMCERTINKDRHFVASFARRFHVSPCFFLSILCYSTLFGVYIHGLWSRIPNVFFADRMTISKSVLNPPNFQNLMNQLKAAFTHLLYSCALHRMNPFSFGHPMHARQRIIFPFILLIRFMFPW